MSREILFKAKTTKKDNPKHEFNEKWVEGNLILCRGKAYIHPISNKIRTTGEIGRIIVLHEVIPNTICQYTGLTDKNGKKIWENDICDRKEKYPEIVTYNKGDWQLDYSYALGKEKHFCACNLGFYACERECVEVIGNVFDNPELLEV
ncbi:hypothetical protein HMPREF0992_00163 [Lachnospiraceae bacterium 6_1_63FAA]|nr:hypothetical protein HMPREF0992_00163 [Lachnospiraceae bacterium 6_1_63FAA]